MMSNHSQFIFPSYQMGPPFQLISNISIRILIILSWYKKSNFKAQYFNACLSHIIIYKMLRLFTKLIHPFARKIGSSRHRPSPVAEDEQQAAPIKKAVRSQYQQMKQKFTKLEQEQALLKTDNKSSNKTMDFIEKMLLENLAKEKAQIKSKVKPTLEDKMRKLGLPEEMIGTNLAKSLQKKTFKRESLQFKDPNSGGIIQQILKQTGSLEEINEEREIKLAQQQLMIQEILKKGKEKQVKVQDNETLPVIGEKEYEKKLLLRKEKIIQSLQQKQDPSNIKIQLNTEDLLAIKYSPQILAKAQEYKNKQIKYFKDLVVNDERGNRRKEDMLKRRYKDQQDEKKFIAKQDQKALNRIQPQLPNLYKQLKGEQGLTLFEDEEFYKKKAVKQISQKQQLTKQDLKLKQELDRDLEIGDKISEIFLDQVVYHKETKLQKQIQYQQTSFGKQQKKLKDLNDKLINLGLEFNIKQIQQLSKQLLFEEKHFLEEQQGFQKYLQRKEKKKNMKKQLKAIHDKTLRDDVDFNKEEVPQMSVKQIKNSSEYSQLEDDYKKIQQYQEQKESLFVQQTPQEKKSQIHMKKTLKNMSNFVLLYFVSGLYNHNASQFDSIEILEIIPNRSNTVLNVFWNIQNDYLIKNKTFPQDPQYQQKYQQLKKKIQQSLKKQSGYISGRMTQLLRLRYGPDIRFFYDVRTSKTIQAIQQLRRYTKEIAMVELEEYSKKGLVSGQKQSAEYYDKLLDVAKSQLHEFNNRKLLLSKKYQKNNRQDQKDQQSKVDPTSILEASKKKKRKNPILEENEEDQQKKPPSVKLKNKKKPSQRLWDTIDLL